MGQRKRPEGGVTAKRILNNPELLEALAIHLELPEGTLPKVVTGIHPETGNDVHQVGVYQHAGGATDGWFTCVNHKGQQCQIPAAVIKELLDDEPEDSDEPEGAAK